MRFRMTEFYHWHHTFIVRCWQKLGPSTISVRRSQLACCWVCTASTCPILTRQVSSMHLSRSSKQSSYGFGLSYGILDILSPCLQQGNACRGRVDHQAKERICDLFWFLKALCDHSEQSPPAGYLQGCSSRSVGHTVGRRAVHA